MSRLKSNFCLFFVSMLMFSSAHADHSYISDFSSSLDIADSQNGQVIGKAGYNIPSGTSPWKLNPWGNPSNLTPQTFPVNTSWSLNNAYSRVKYYPQLNGVSNVYELAASNIPCTSGSPGNPLEVDMFLTPNITLDSATLGSMGELNLGVDMGVTYSDLQHGCSNNFTIYTASLILSTANVTPAQVLYVQIELGGTNPAPSSPVWCPSYENISSPDVRNQFCVNYSVTAAGGQFISTYGSQSYNLDILPSLISLLQSNHAKPAPNSDVVLNNNPNNWVVGGVYIGTINYGTTNTASIWSRPKLDNNGGAFCSGATKTQFVCNNVPAGQGWSNVGGSCYHRPSNVSC